MNVTDDQPDPLPGSQRVVDYVLVDINNVVEKGLKHYGTYLQTHNGRDALVDAYQEAIDMVFYLRQAILERDGK
jgi:hypothetical protein